jgi:hypothetical protein
MNAITIENLAAPKDITPLATQAVASIVAVLVMEGSDYTGGCKTFYSPQEWAERGEKYGKDSLLIVAHDGGEVSRYFDYDRGDYSAIARMDNALRLLGLFAEAQTNWYTAIYPT